METLVITSKTKGDLNLIVGLAKKLGLKSKFMTREEKEDQGLLEAMLEVDRNDKVSRESVMNILNEKCK